MDQTDRKAINETTADGSYELSNEDDAQGEENAAKGRQQPYSNIRDRIEECYGTLSKWNPSAFLE